MRPKEICNVGAGLATPLTAGLREKKIYIYISVRKAKVRASSSSGPCLERSIPVVWNQLDQAWQFPIRDPMQGTAAGQVLLLSQAPFRFGQNETADSNNVRKLLETGISVYMHCISV